MEGLVFGRYRITHRLGEGGMAEVWAAKHELMDQDAAVKMLLPAMSQNEQIVKRFFNEAQAAARIKHPGIVDVFDVGYAPDGRAYIIMERLDGENLHRRVERTRTLPLDQAITWMRQLAGVMSSAHERGIIHRDLKPENLFIVPDPDVTGGERIKVLDFGLAKLAVGAGSVLTAQGAIFGTPAYMAPEQCEDAANVDVRVDLYAIGCIFYRCLCGRPPFGTGGLSVLQGHMFRQPVRPSELSDGLPPMIDDLIMKLLAKSPDDRVQSCADLVELLDQANSSGQNAVPAANLDDAETGAYQAGSLTGGDEVSTLPDVDGAKNTDDVTTADPEDSTFPGAEKTDYPGAEDSTLPGVEDPGDSAETAVTLPNIASSGGKTPELDSTSMKTLVSERPSGRSPARPHHPPSGPVRPPGHGHGADQSPRRHRELLWAFAGSLAAGIVIAAVAIGFGGGGDDAGDAGPEIAALAVAKLEPDDARSADAGEVSSPGDAESAGLAWDAGIVEPGADSGVARTVASTESAVSRDALVDASVAAPASSRSSTGPETVARPNSRPAAPAITAKQQADDIRSAFSAGDHARASLLCRRAQWTLRKDHNTLTLCALAACKQGKAAVARRYVRRLQATGLVAVQQGCLKSGVDLTGAK